MALTPVTMQSIPTPSAAVNIQIIEPKNLVGSQQPGPGGTQVQGGNPAAPTITIQPGQVGGQASAQTTPTGAPNLGAFPVRQPGQPLNASSVNSGQQPNTLFPATTPQQQLQQAYAYAISAKNQAEQARNQYLNMANQLNQQATVQHQQRQQQAQQQAMQQQAFIQQQALQQQALRQQALQQQALLQQQAQQRLAQPQQPGTVPRFGVGETPRNSFFLSQ